MIPFLLRALKYLDGLSEQRTARILKFLEKKPRDARSISKEIEPVMRIPKAS
jgi:hypothetical protein